MKALLYSTYGQLQLASLPRPTPGPRDVLVSVAACGICGSELESFANQSPRRPPPLVMGHEFCGTVEQVGDQVDAPYGWSEGQQVVSNSVVSCQRCPPCHRGDTHLCKDRQVFGMHRPGAFAEYVAVPVHCLLPWPHNLTAAAACLAEPLGNGVHVVNLTKHLPADRVLIVGVGPIGLMCQQAFQALRNSSMFATDLRSDRLQVAELLGAHPIGTSTTDLVDEVLSLTDGEGVDIVVDAVGSAATKRQSLACVRDGGAAVWIGLHENELTLNSYEVTLREKQVFGTYATSPNDLSTALDLMVREKVDVQSWVQAFPLAQAADVFHRMLAAGKGDIKAVLVP